MNHPLNSARQATFKAKMDYHRERSLLANRIFSLLDHDKLELIARSAIYDRLQSDYPTTRGNWAQADAVIHSLMAEAERI